MKTYIGLSLLDSPSESQDEAGHDFRRTLIRLSVRLTVLPARFYEAAQFHDIYLTSSGPCGSDSFADVYRSVNQLR